jgi:hypothetical protein
MTVLKMSDDKRRYLCRQARRRLDVLMILNMSEAD